MCYSLYYRSKSAIEIHAVKLQLMHHIIFYGGIYVAEFAMTKTIVPKEYNRISVASVC